MFESQAFGLRGGCGVPGPQKYLEQQLFFFKCTVDPPEIAEDISFLQKDKHYLFEIAKDISWGQRKPEIYLSQEDIST